MPEPLSIPVGSSADITLAVGDITREGTEAIVNAANSSLMGGGGVDGAIHRAGGPAILDECRQIVARQGSLPPGQAVATSGGRLAAKYVIHTVGPIWSGGDHGEPDTLANCYRNSVRLADELGLNSIAFPSISTGAFGYPVRDAARVAISALADALAGFPGVKHVRFVLFDQQTFDAYAQAARAFTNSSRANK